MNEELKVIITAETDKLKSGVSSAKDALGGIGKVAAEVGKAVGTAMAAAGAAVLKIGKDALESYSSFQQLKGGVETLYKGASDDIMKYAQEAYATTGMTANKYMETATTFAAALTSALDGDVKKAAESTNMAVNDMADNASIFGTSMESVQNAYNGFAKQNYTMLDNLKLGYGGTKEEMQRLLEDAQKLTGVKYDINNLNDVYSAIHAIQEEMGITDNAANEAARTIEGSINATKAAYGNLLTGLMDETADVPKLVSNLVESGLNVLKNVKPRIKQFADSIPQVIKTALPQILPIVNDLISSLLPVVIEGSTSILNAVVKAIPQLAQAILGSAPQLIKGFTEVINTLVKALPSLVQVVIDALPTIIPALIEGIVSMIVTLCQSINEIITPIIDALPMIITSIVTTLIENLPALIQGVIQLVIGIVNSVDQIITTLVPMIPTIFIQLVVAIVKEIPTILGGVLEVVVGIAKCVADWYKSWIEGVGKALKSILDKIGDFLKDLLKKIKDKFEEIKNGITEKVENAKTAVKEKFEAIRTGIQEKVEAVKSKVTDTFEKVKTAITSPIEKARDAVKGVIDKIKGFFNFTVNLPKIKLPHFSISPSGWKIGDLLQGSIPKLGISWYAKGGVFDQPTLFPFGNGKIGGLGENGAEAVVPLEKNTKWLDKIAAKLGANSNRPVYLIVDGKVFAETTISTLNDYTNQTGGLPIKVM